MKFERQNPFRSHLSRDEFSALEQVSRGIAVSTSVSQQLIERGLAARAMGHLVLTQKGAMSLVSGPAL